MTRISLPTSALHDLLVPVLPHAGTDTKNLPELAAIRLEVANDNVYAVGTDRYTLAVTRHALNEPHPDGAITVTRAEAAAALRLFTATKDDDPALTIDIDIDTLRIRSEDTTLVLQTIEYADVVQFPNWRKIIGKALHRQQDDTPRGIMINPEFAPRWRAAGRLGHNLRCLFGASPHDPILIVAGDDFAGLWIPIRELDTARDDWLEDLSWRDEIGQPDPVQLVAEPA